MRVYYLWDDQHCIDYVDSIWSSPTDNDKYFIMFNEPTRDTALSTVAEYDRFEIEYMFHESVKSGYLILGNVIDVYDD